MAKHLAARMPPTEHLTFTGATTGEGTEISVCAKYIGPLEGYGRVGKFQSWWEEFWIAALSV